MVRFPWLRRRSGWRVLVPSAGGLAGLALVLVLTCCRGPTGPTSDPSDNAANAGVDRGPPVARLEAEPTIRVRVRRSPDRVSINGQALAIGPTGDRWASDRRRLTSPVTIDRQDGAFRIRSGDGAGLRWPADRLRVQSLSRSATLAIGDQRYPGHLTLVATPWKRGPSPTTFDVINHLPIERYVPGVLAKELYGSWDAAAFRAQAIAVRSYALFEAYEHRDRHFDLASTTASQVYQGLSDHPTALSAGRATRGQVLVHRGRVLPAYYASACGGTGQSAHLAFDAGWPVDPLMGRAGQTWCRASPKYRWGPITRRTRDLAWRLRQWGSARQHAVARLHGLSAIRVSRENDAGRPAVFTLVDDRGQSFAIRCEAFRIACNYDAGSLSDVPEAKRLFSSHVSVNVQGEVVRFTDGRGFGHGVGLCQWGAQGMAQQGYGHRRILAQYYTGASLQQLY